MAKKKNLKRITFISAIITLISFIYKFGLAFLAKSSILMIASISTLMVFICKALFVKNLTKTKDKKRHAYFFMALALIVYALIFLFVVVLKLNGYDFGDAKTYEGWLEILFILFLTIMFILSVLGLRGALDKTDLMVIGLKEITLAAAMTDLVIIEEFVGRTILDLTDKVSTNFLDKIHAYFSLGIGFVLIFIGIIMIFRFLKRTKDDK